jgi:RNA polymerase primary sigma factor
MGEDGDEARRGAGRQFANAEPPAKAAEDEPELDADGNPIAKDDDDDEDDQANMSLAAMEAALKPRVLDTLDRIAEDYARLSEMQDKRISATLNEDGQFSSRTRRPTRSCAPRSWSWSTSCTCTTTGSRR